MRWLRYCTVAYNQSQVADKLAARDWGNLVVVVDPGLLRGSAEACLAAATAVADRVRAARPAGEAAVRLPGERSAALAGVPCGGV